MDVLDLPREVTLAVVYVDEQLTEWKAVVGARLLAAVGAGLHRPAGHRGRSG